MKEDHSGQRKNTWSLLKGTTHILLYSAGGSHGYRFLDRAISKINRRAICATDVDEMRVIVCGGQVNELSVSGYEKSLDEALGGFYTSKDFEKNPKEQSGPEIRYEISWLYEGIMRTLKTQYEVEVISEEEVLVTFSSGRKLRILDPNLSLVCWQIRKSDDDYDLSALPPPTFSNTTDHR